MRSGWQKGVGTHGAQHTACICGNAYCVVAATRPWHSNVLHDTLHTSVTFSMLLDRCHISMHLPSHHADSLSLLHSVALCATMKAIVLTVLLGALAYAHAQDTKPWFCHDLDCPTYKLLKNLTDINIEYRSYQAGQLSFGTLLWRVAVCACGA